MPDNSADYDEPDDLSADNDDDPDTHQGLVWNLLLLINPGDEETALRQFDAYRESAGETDGETDGDAWLWALKYAIDWSSGFYVDGSDSETLISAIDELAARWNLRIDWGGDIDDDDFLVANDTAALLTVAYDRLREYGYTLWCWDTGSDDRAGWMALSRNDEDMQRLAAILGADLRPGSDPF
ncbi:DUF6630 family protein [Xanthomonas oryzae]|uniref:DUF6630 family protein n=1 Tax=Xanthomonas oryzae TaxID=347 RepID=UPI000949F217|nr:hypothetical protein [Xanthomonas oryzae]WJS70287.1 hypothetical protein DXO50_003215 [Xanthomonas oryzae pv. oryzae]